MTGYGVDPVEHRLIEALGEPAPDTARRKRSATSPTKRTLDECRKRGWIAQVVERWNPHARIRQDLFGVIDLVAIVPTLDAGAAGAARSPGAILGIQATSGNTGGAHAARRAKILAEPRARAWVAAGGRLELWSWAKRGDRGARKLWTLRVEVFQLDSWPAGAVTDATAGYRRDDRD